MKAIRNRLDCSLRQDDGLTLIEIMIAMMVFAIVAVGVAYSLTSILTHTKDGRSRAAAANLAAQEVDLSRSVENVFTVLDKVEELHVIDGVNYYLTRKTGWVTSDNTEAQCGAAGTVSGGGSLEFKRVNVTVTWDGMREGTTTVRADTLLAPNSRINDPALGTILVSVLTDSGAGSSGITVSAASAGGVGNTAQSITETILPTDSQGCSYIVKVVPGTYNVTISKTGFVDVGQTLNSVTKTIAVSPGLSSSAGFQFEQAATYTPNFAANHVGPKLLPTNLQTTYNNTYGNWAKTGSSAKLYPFRVGYTVMAGAYIEPNETTVGCLSPDPSAWSVAASDGAVGVRDAAATAAPGASVSAPVSMGVLKVTGKNGRFLTAVPQAPPAGSGDPGCATGTNYTFAKLSGSSSTVALPYGSWKLYTGNALGSTSSDVDDDEISLNTRGSIDDDVVTLDPRTVLP